MRAILNELGNPRGPSKHSSARATLLVAIWQCGMQPKTWCGHVWTLLLDVYYGYFAKFAVEPGLAHLLCERTLNLQI